LNITRSIYASEVNDSVTLNKAIIASTANDTAGYNWGPIIDLNITRSIYASEVNDSVTLNTAASLILSNRTALEGEILSNRTNIFTNVLANDTAYLLTADTHISSNASATLYTADSHIASNASAALYTADSHIASNASATLLAADNHILSNLSVVQNEILTNRTAILAATAANLSRMKNLSVMAYNLIPENGIDGARVTPPNSTGMTGTARMHWISLDFPAPTNSTGINASWETIMPSEWSGGTLALTTDWVSTGGTGTIIQSARCYCGLTLGAAYGANISWTTTISTINTVTRATGGAMTCSGSPAASAHCWLQFQRLGGTLTGVGSLGGWRVDYSV
jgi:hypothetical protein